MKPSEFSEFVDGACIFSIFRSLITDLTSLDLRRALAPWALIFIEAIRQKQENILLINYGHLRNGM